MTDETLIELYAGALAVVYPPFDEDFGYVTLEAFLARKPVVTGTDSGGPNEFVVDGVNGYVCEPSTRGAGGRASTGWRPIAAAPRRSATPDTSVRAPDHLGRRHRDAGRLIARTARIAIMRRFR